MCPLCNEGISTLKKNQLPQLHSSAFDMKLFTVAVKDIIKQPLTFTFGEAENGDDDCDGDSYVVDDDIHDGSTADVILKLGFLSWGYSLLASGRLVKVGRSIGVRHKLVIFRRNIASF